MAVITVLLATSVAGCEIGFTPELTPVEWQTSEPSGLGQGSTLPSPQLSPIPLAPTSLPPKLEFDGVEDLEGGEPMLDNDVYGYCKIPGTNQYYIWIPCVEACPDSPCYGTLVKRVDESTVVEEFRTLAKEWDAAKATQDDFMFTGVGAGLGELIIGGLTFGAACLVGTKFTFGTSCAAWFATAGLGGGVVWYSASRSIEEGNTMTSKQNAAQERYDEIPEATPRPSAP